MLLLVPQLFQTFPVQSPQDLAHGHQILLLRGLMPFRSPWRRGLQILPSLQGIPATLIWNATYQAYGK